MGGSLIVGAVCPAFFVRQLAVCRQRNAVSLRDEAEVIREIVCIFPPIVSYISPPAMI
jgi:hypothetical protein